MGFYLQLSTFGNTNTLRFIFIFQHSFTKNEATIDTTRGNDLV